MDVAKPYFVLDDTTLWLILIAILSLSRLSTVFQTQTQSSEDLLDMKGIQPL